MIFGASKAKNRRKNTEPRFKVGAGRERDGAGNDPAEPRFAAGDG